MLIDQYATAVLAACILTLLLYLWKRSNNVPPGPWGMPLLGYIPFMSGKPEECFHELSKRYGKVFSFRTTGGKLMVILNGYKTAKDVLVGRADEFHGRPHEANLIAWVSDGLGVAQEEGTPWKDQRRFFLQSVKNFGFGKQSLESSIQDDIKLMIDDLQKTNGKPVDLTLYLSHATNSIISQILFSRKQDKNDPLFQEMCLGLDSMVQMFAAGHVLSVGWYFDYIVMNFFPGCTTSKAGKRIIKKIVDEIVDDHIRTFDPEHIRDFVDDYLFQRNKLQKSGELEKSTFTLPRLRAIALNMFFEGTLSISAAIKGFLCELSKHESDQKRAQLEIDAVIGKERPPSWLDKPNLPFFDALVLELYRTTMPFNISTLYSNYKETTIQGYRIPERSIILSSLWSMNNDPELFKNPSRFDPRRFLGPDGKRIKQDGPFTFGVGKRACIGESLAQMEVFLFIACILQAFTLYPADKEANLVKLIPRE